MRAGGAHAGARCAHGGPGGTGVGSVAWRGSRVGGQLQLRQVGLHADCMGGGSEANCARCVENRGAWTSLIMAFVA